ncbi:MAG TPA: glycosyltransferase family 9 protein [Candidatus Latescibacteria bacterium]|nr:glycosyltransferase family 9 protein [Candidatus Latescibacterota bacterium]
MNRILVIRTGAIGDLVLTLPVIGALRAAYPDAQIEVMGYPSRLSLIDGRYYADRISSIDQQEIAPFFSENSSLSDRLVSYFSGFDLIVSFCVDEDGVFADNLRRTGAGQVLSLNPIPDPNCSAHIIEHLLEPIRALGVPVTETSPKIFLASEDRKFAEAFWQEHRLEQAVAIHPGSGSRKKRWRPERFATLSDWVMRDLEAAVILISGPADEDAVMEVANRITAGRPVILETPSLVHLASIIERCGCFVGNDSGISHIAAAVGTPTVAIFGPSDAEVWGPRGDHTVILKGEIDCSPCTREQMNACPHTSCLGLVEEREVREKVKGLLTACGRAAPERRTREMGADHMPDGTPGIRRVFM